MTPKQSARRIATLNRQLDRIRQELVDIYHKQPVLPDGFRGDGCGSLMLAVEKILCGQELLRESARDIGDTRTPEEKRLAEEQARQEERREHEMRVYGCTSD